MVFFWGGGGGFSNGGLWWLLSSQHRRRPQSPPPCNRTQKSKMRQGFELPPSISRTSPASVYLPVPSLRNTARMGSTSP
jgi:hypothetical protein